jgi:hypothetical protein
MRSLVVLLLMLAACFTTQKPSGTTTDPRACSVDGAFCPKFPCRGCSIECPEGKTAVCKPGHCAIDTEGKQVCGEDPSCTCQ